MIRRSGIYNTKRKLQSSPTPEYLSELTKRVGYGGNPEHKRNPGDFYLTPPSSPRADKTLCDTVGIFSKIVALSMLKDGISKGLISVQTRGFFPQNVWAVTNDREPLEAQLENEDRGIYHGYPMAHDDPFRKVILEHWFGDEK